MGIFLLCTGMTALGQDLRGILIDENQNGKIFSIFLEEIEQRHDVDFIFDVDELQAYTINGVTGRQRLLEFLDKFLVHHIVTRVSDNVVFIVERSADRFGDRRQDFIVLKKPEADEVTVHGRLTDSGNGEPIIGAQVRIDEINSGTLTDVNGNFSLRLPTDRIHHLSLQYVGYENYHYIIGFSPYASETRIEVSLFPESKQLETVTVTAEQIDVNVKGELSGMQRLNIETIKSIPTFMGEVDPVRSLTTLPGVSTAGELASGFNVRGGEAGQNLILQDGAPIYNPSHLFGFFSAFNPDMVSDVSLYKGGGPANFGGRVSSVLKVDLKNGDAGKHTINGGVGLVSSRLSVEGPIRRGKSSYLLGGRISYTNWLVRATQNVQLQKSAADFYDVTAKVFLTLNDNNFLSVTGYASHDDFRLATDSVFSWGTMNASLRWDHTFNENLAFVFTAFNSNYYSDVTSRDEIEPFLYQNEINTTGIKFDLNYNTSERLKFLGGLEANRVVLEPGKITPTAEGNVVPLDMRDQQGIESALYIQSDFDLTEKLGVSAGLRYSHYMRMGPDEIYTFDYSNLEGRYPTITDTTAYRSGEIIKSFGGLEPRISLRYLIRDDLSLKASYYRGYQYLHLISNTTSTTPQDYWVASGPYLRPEIGDQYSLGVFTNMKNNAYEISVEGFYKETANAVDFIEGADITLNPALEAGLAQGRGLAYGVEALFRKNPGGKIDGWLSYTWSRSLRQFESSEFTTIDEGRYYASSYDKPHNVSLILNYHLGERTVLSANFNYSTGRPITIPVSKFSYDVYLSVLNYSRRNEYRIPDYHRLDLSITFKDRPRKNKRWMGEWVLSVFNVYGRDNAYSIYFSRYGTANKVSVLGTVFPSFSYNFRF
jgi:hypothetical protein